MSLCTFYKFFSLFEWSARSKSWWWWFRSRISDAWNLHLKSECLIYHEFQHRSCVLSVCEILSSTFVGITFKSFQFRFKAFTLSIVLQTPVFWRPSQLKASKICKRTSIYRPTRHTVLEVAIFHSSDINEFHPNTQHIRPRQGTLFQISSPW